MSNAKLRISIIGAGRFTRLWHVPRLAAAAEAARLVLAAGNGGVLTDSGRHLVDAMLWWLMRCSG